MAGGPQIIPCRATPRPVTGEPSAHQRPIFASPEEQRGTMAGMWLESGSSVEVIGSPGSNLETGTLRAERKCLTVKSKMEEIGCC